MVRSQRGTQIEQDEFVCKSVKIKKIIDDRDKRVGSSSAHKTKLKMIIEHTEFDYPQPETHVQEIRVPRHQLFHRKRSDSENLVAFQSFLAAVEAMHCDHYSHTTVFLTHDAETCFICDGTKDVMHMLRHRKGSQQILRFGPAPPENIADIFARYGLYLEVDTSSQYNDELPICSDCKAIYNEQGKDYFCPAVRIAECTMAESIMFRHWRNGVAWDCCSAIKSEKHAP